MRGTHKIVENPTLKLVSMLAIPCAFFLHIFLKTQPIQSRPGLQKAALTLLSTDMQHYEQKAKLGNMLLKFVNRAMKLPFSSQVLNQSSFKGKNGGADIELYSHVYKIQKSSGSPALEIIFYLIHISTFSAIKIVELNNECCLYFKQY